MTTGTRPQGPKTWLTRASLAAGCTLSASLLLAISQAAAAAADAPAGLTPEQAFEGGTNSYNNWIELSAGGMMTRGDAAQAAQQQHISRGAFGGIEDLHIQQDLDKKTTFTLDGHSIFDNKDYQISLGVKREDLGYVRVGFENFRTWYDPSGGFFSPDGSHFTYAGNGMGLDRGQIFFETGLNLKDMPKVTFKYAHTYRDGDKNSTAWGPVAVNAAGPSGFNPVTRAIYPSFWDIDEKNDSFQLDVTHRIKATDLGMGVRFDTGSINDALNTKNNGNDPFVQQSITDRQGTTYDMESVHFFSETWLKKNLMFSTGLLFANEDTRLFGSRTYGEDFNANYRPDFILGTGANGNGLGYYNLNGSAHQQEYLLNVNLLTIPLKNFSIVPSLKVRKEDWNSDANGIGTRDTFAEPFNATSDRSDIEVRERVDFRYSGMTNWVFYAGPELTQGDGTLRELGGLSQINGIGPAPIDRQTDDTTFYQKYFAGARWYPHTRVTVDVGGYYKDNRYDYQHNIDSTFNGPTSFDRYPAFLVMQNLKTYDGNSRLTLRPLRNVTLVTSYDYQRSYIQTAPDSISTLSELDSSTMTSHIIGQNIGWVPWSRLSLQLGFNYVLSDTRTPTSEFTQAVLNSLNDYWTLNFNAGIVLDNKTDLNLGGFYYRSSNYQDNAFTGESLPLGTAAEEWGITAGLVRRLTQNIRLNLKYAYTQLNDYSSGGFNNYEAHLVYSSLQYRF